MLRNWKSVTIETDYTPSGSHAKPAYRQIRGEFIVDHTFTPIEIDIPNGDEDLKLALEASTNPLRNRVETLAPAPDTILVAFGFQVALTTAARIFHTWMQSKRTHLFIKSKGRTTELKTSMNEADIRDLLEALGSD